MSRKQHDLNCWYCDVFCATDTTVFGTYHTRLCQECRNELHLAIGDHALVREKDEILTKADMLTARTVGDGVDRTEELLELTSQLRAINRSLYQVAEAWVLGRDKAHADG